MIKQIGDPVFSIGEEVFETDYFLGIIQQMFKKMRAEKIFINGDEDTRMAVVVFNLPIFA